MKSKTILAIIAMAMLLVTVQQALAEDVTITSQPVTSATMNMPYEYQVTATSPHGDPLTYSLVQNPSGMTIGGDTGLITWTPGQAGTFPVNVSATDGNTTGYQAYEITVTADPSQISADHLRLGSTTQKRDQFILSQPWEISNTGSYDITGLQGEVIGVHERYNFSLQIPATTIPAGGSVTAYATIYVPKNEDAGQRDLGMIRLTGTSQGEQRTLDRTVSLEVQNNLVIEEIEVRIGGRRERLTSPGSVSRNAQLGDEIEVRVKVKNTFDETMDIEDIELETFSDDLWDADGLDDFISRLRRGRTADLVVRFTIDPREVDPFDAPFYIDLMVTGIDENNARHGETWFISLDLETRTRDIRILDTRMSPTILRCDERIINVDVEIRNLGTRDTDTAMLRYDILDVDFLEWHRDIEIYEGETRNINRRIQVPANLEAGVYYLQIDAYPLRTGSSTDTELLTFTVEACPVDEQPPTPTPTPPPIDDTTIIPGTPVDRTAGERGFLGLQGDAYIVLLGALVLILLIVVVILMVLMARK